MALIQTDPASPTVRAPSNGGLSMPAAQPRLRTLFIVLDSGTAIRNILRTNVFKVLKETPGLRIVVFSPITDAEFKREFEAENVIVEPLPQWNTNVPVRLLRSMKKDIWAEKVDLFTFKSKRKRKEGRFLRRFLLGLVTRGNDPRRVDSLLDWIDQREIRHTPPMAAEYFERYQPDLVFYTTQYSKTHCLEIGARQRGVKTASFILSWDNPTSKGPFPVRPDRVILWNNILRDELVRYHGFKPEQLCVAGVPQFDLYADRSGYQSREEFFRKWRLDPAKKLITYTTGTPGTAPFDHEVVDLLYRAMQRGVFRQPCQLLVRLHPKDRYDDYTRFENLPGLVLQLPGRRADTQDAWNPTREDMFGLAELMAYSNVVVNVASTTTIDAAAVDTPVVNVAFDGYKTRPFAESCQRYYQYEHYRRIVETGGVKISRSIEELTGQIQAYLDDPSQEAEGRNKIREEQCWKLDGQSGRRIAEYLLAFIEEPWPARKS